MKKAARKLVAAARKELDAEMARLEELERVRIARAEELRRQADELDRTRADALEAEARTQAELQRVRRARKALDELNPPQACREQCVCGECGPHGLGYYRDRAR